MKQVKYGPNTIITPAKTRTRRLQVAKTDQ